MKNKLIAAIVAVACLIPSGVAYASYRRTQSAPVDTSNAVSISIDDPTGKNYTYIKERDGDTGDRLIQYFLSMKDRAQAISSLPDSLSGEQFYMVTISAAVKSVTYEYYFSIDPSTCYFVAPDGMPYKINEEDAKEFITTEYAESLYKEAEMPKLTLSHSVEVTPDEASWLYKNFTGGYVEADTSSMVYANIESYDIEGGLDLSFDVQPDFCSVKVTDATETALYDGMLENLSEFTLDKTKQILVEVNAKWYEDSSRAFYGNLIYNFASYVSAPAEFYAGMNLVDAGKFVAITALNVTKPENITMTSNMPGVQDITFFSETDSIAVGLLPIDLDTPTGTYDLTFTYGGTIAHVTLTVQNNGVNASYYSVDEAVVASARSSAALLQFEGATKEIMATASPTRYFSGSFLDGMTGFYTLQRGFGRDIYVNGATSPTYRNNGVDYSADAGLDVMACNKGEVVYAGELDYAGNIIVIEHGYGLKTWYYNLGSVTVSVGDIVEKGQGIGTTGFSGFTGQNGAHIAMSVGSTFVSPYDTWEDSQFAGKVVIAKIDE